MNAKTFTYNHKHICPAKQQHEKHDIEYIVVDKLNQTITIENKR